MEINPHLNTDSFEAAFKAIDTHTVGEFTRIILSGFPPLKGDTMIERKNYLAEHYDKYRTALMFEPRGHHDMFGALLTDPIHPEADFGVIFMDTGEYLNMCGRNHRLCHCTHRNRACGGKGTLYRSGIGCSCRIDPNKSRSQKWKSLKRHTHKCSCFLI